MSASVASSPSAAAEKRSVTKTAATVRAAFANHVKASTLAWQRIDKMPAAQTFCGCCGTHFLQNGLIFAGTHPKGGEYMYRKPFKTPDEAKEWYMETYKWEDYKDSYIRSYGSEESGKYAWENWRKSYSARADANLAGITIATGMEVSELVNLMFTPDHELYKVVSGIELNDKEVGKVSLIWTNV